MNSAGLILKLPEILPHHKGMWASGGWQLNVVYPKTFIVWIQTKHWH